VLIAVCNCWCRRFRHAALTLCKCSLRVALRDHPRWLNSHVPATASAMPLPPSTGWTCVRRTCTGTWQTQAGPSPPTPMCSDRGSTERVCSFTRCRGLTLRLYYRYLHSHQYTTFSHTVLYHSTSKSRGCSLHCSQSMYLAKCATEHTLNNNTTI